MFIVWGKKHVRRKMGYVVDFCPLCRAPEVFRLDRVGLASHVYYITSGDGELIGYERSCENCKTVFAADPQNYRSVSKAKSSLQQLRQQTFPDMSEVLAERLALEEKVQKTPALLTPDERAALIQAPFVLLSPRVEQRYASTQVDMEAGLTMLGALALIFIGPAIVEKISPENAEASMLTFILLGVAMSIWQLIMGKQRFVRREIIPVLAHALRPLRPTDHEMRSVLDLLKQHKHKMGSGLKLADLVASLKQAETARQ